MTMTWIMYSGIAIAVILLATWIQETNRKLASMNKLLEIKVDNLESCLAKLSEAVAENAKPELSPEEEIERKVQEAKMKVFDDWIDSIVNYDPRVQQR